MNNSIVIAQILGIFFAVVGVSMALNKKTVMAAMEEAVQNRGYLWLWGFLAVATGAIILPLNNVWTSGLPLLITILGWLALIKGVFIFVFPDVAVSMYRKFNSSGVLVFCGLVALILGLVLLYMASL